MSTAPDPRDRSITHGATVVGVREYGGTGSPILLLHGAGSDRTSWDAVAPALIARHRVVAVDLRGHGRSGDGPWNWETVLDDLDVAVAALELGNPAVVGHSVGGLVAARWAGRHPACPGVIDLDGHRVAGSDPDHLAPAAGEDAEALATAAVRFGQWLEGFFVQMESTLPPERAAAAAAARAALRDDDLASLRGIPVPVLLVVAERDPRGLPAAWAPMMRAFRAGLRRDLDDLGRTHPHLEVAGIDASHAMTAERPQQVAALIDRFLTTAVRR